MKKLQQQLNGYKQIMIPNESPPLFSSFLTQLQSDAKVMDIQAEHDKLQNKVKMRRWFNVVVATTLIITIAISLPLARAYVLDFFRGIAEYFSAENIQPATLPRLTHKDVELIHTTAITDGVSWAEYSWKSQAIIIIIEPVESFRGNRDGEFFQTGVYNAPLLNMQGEYFSDKDGIYAMLPYDNETMLTIIGRGITDIDGFLEIAASLSRE